MCYFRFQVTNLILNLYYYPNLFIYHSSYFLSYTCKESIYISQYCFYRSESKDTILASLSEDAKCKRRRKHTIGIQITVISWFLELVGGCIIISRFLIFQKEDDEDEWTDRILALSDIFVCLIPIPLSYLLNDEAIKLAIHAKGWISLLRRPNQMEYVKNQSQHLLSMI